MSAKIDPLTCMFRFFTCPNKTWAELGKQLIQAKKRSFTISFSNSSTEVSPGILAVYNCALLKLP